MVADPNLLRLLDKLVPQKDGEPYTVHRTAVVNAVNSDGTVDLTLSGVTVPDVPVLGGAGVWVGGTVSVLAWQGALLVLGVSRAATEGIWQSYTPALGNVTLGTGGVVTGAYRRTGDTIDYEWSVRLGTGGALTGGLLVGLPVNRVNDGFARTVGNVYLQDATPAAFAQATHSATTGQVGSLQVRLMNSNQVNATTPWTWAVNDTLTGSGRYRAAP